MFVQVALISAHTRGPVGFFRPPRCGPCKHTSAIVYYKKYGHLEVSNCSLGPAHRVNAPNARKRTPDIVSSPAPLTASKLKASRRARDGRDRSQRPPAAATCDMFMRRPSILRRRRAAADLRKLITFFIAPLSPDEGGGGVVRCRVRSAAHRDVKKKTKYFRPRSQSVPRPPPVNRLKGSGNSVDSRAAHPAPRTGAVLICETHLKPITASLTPFKGQNTGLIGERGGLILSSVLILRNTHCTPLEKIEGVI
ncbi:hypothetical protein EVAR_46726_1 [Eumeta japonica]|uniref:Uncharacterized protein n=1 Tax=Eumeta variegata TaxID=151549 RepID=A0A4C1X9M8_EUMVA|nr:hypothetical protein EVAR_46726_1 [Eumeta japonica]